VEVLFAIGIIAIGLAGVTAVLPIALHRIGQGNIADRASRLGLNSVEDFHTRGMAAPANWRRMVWNSSLSQNVWGTVPIAADWKQAYAIDPQFVATNSAITTTSYNEKLFPYYPLPASTTQVRMLRISLAPISGATPGMTRLHANRVFNLDDELSFDIPSEKTLPPAQKFSVNTVAAGLSSRQYESLFSWMATLAPKIDKDGMFKDLYNLSIVVFHRRDYSFAMFNDENFNQVEDLPTEGPTYNEILLDIPFIPAPAASPPRDHFPGAGYRGGDVILEADTTTELDIKDGDWLMLSGRFAVVPGDSSFDVPMFRWYRVLAADSDPRPWSSQYPSASSPNPTPKNLVLDVTLQGADWPYNRIRGGVTKAVYLPGVVQVFEKTIRLEDSSLF
jgi:hypothetical protein